VPSKIKKSSIKKYSIQKTSNSKIDIFNIILVLIFIALISITIIIRIRTLAVPFERDEGEYAYAGQLMLEGVPPYSQAYNMKMPGIYAAYAVILAVFGQTVSGIHFAVLIINTATILLLFFMAKKLFGPVAGVAAAVFFAISSISIGIQATANAENFVVLPAIAGIILLMKFSESKKYISLITGGILLGIGFMMKQHGAGFILFGFFYLLLNGIRQKPKAWEKTAGIILIYSFSSVLPFLVTCIILWRCGVFAKFWFWTFEYARSYVSIVPYETGFMLLRSALAIIVPPIRFIWLSAIFGFLSIIWNKEIRKHGAFLVSFLICSFLSVCPGFYFRGHYFVLFLPVLGVLGSVGVIAIRDLLGLGIKSAPKRTFISILVFLAIWLQCFYSQKKYLLETDPVRVSRANFGNNPFPETMKIAKFIKDNSNKEDKIAVFGSEPEIFFYSHRRSATPYIYIYPLMEPQPYALDMQREMISQIEANPPRFVVIVKYYFSWLVQRNSERLILEWLDQYVLSHYRQIGLVEVLSPYETLYHWDSNTKSSKEDDWIFIGERIDKVDLP
jgi:hypothetical protein